MQHIKAIIWDFDGVKYALNEEINLLFRNQCVRMARKYLPNITDEQATCLAVESYLQHQSNYDFLFIDHPMDREEITTEFHAGIDFSHLLSPVSESYLQGMAACDVKHAILTHGNRPYLERKMAYLKIDHLFDADSITTIEDIYPDKKSKSTKPYDYVLNKLQCQAHEAIMVEDSSGNLKYAKDAGLTTVLLRAPDTQKPADYVDYMFATPEDFLAAFAAARQTNWQQMKL